MQDPILDELNWSEHPAVPSSATPSTFEELGLKEKDFVWTGIPQQGIVVEFKDVFIWLLGAVVLLFGLGGFYQGLYRFNLIETLGISFTIALILIVVLFSFQIIYYAVEHLPMVPLLGFSLLGELYTLLEVGALGLHLGWFFTLMVGAGCYMLVGGHWQDSQQRKHIQYKMTASHLYILYKEGYAAYPLGQLFKLELNRRADQKGLIYFEGKNTGSYHPKATYWLRSLAPVLYYVSNIEEVYPLLQQQVATTQAAYTYE